MNKRKLGAGGPEVSAIGLGCMGMSEFYGPSDEKASIETLQTALDDGVNFLDTADMYGIGHNESLVGRAIADWKGKREDVILATKFGIVRKEGSNERSVSGKPEYVKQACEASLKRLGMDYIDLYYQHRVDPDVPIEDTVGAMAELVRAGKVRMLGLSEASAATIERAQKIHPITALQTEYSLWTRDVENEILPVLRKNGTALVAYSPLGRGFLTGAIAKPSDLAENDFRRFNPRFQGENFEKNQKLLENLKQFAAQKNSTPAQVALAWLLARGSDVIPIPGTRKVSRLRENIGAAELKLSDEEIAELDSAFPPQAAAGTRYPEALMGSVNR
ncbi:MAG: aldo/keto reductase [Leptospiraceae bacterium]|nr:aldo/keto reductase [Leptospiraceae bacterium]